MCATRPFLRTLPTRPPGAPWERQPLHVRLMARRAARIVGGVPRPSRIWARHHEKQMAPGPGGVAQWFCSMLRKQIIFSKISVTLIIIMQLFEELEI